MRGSRRVSVVVVGYGREPRLYDCLSAVAADTAAVDEILLVDNGIRELSTVMGDLRGQVTVVNDGSNVGFAEGCNIGAKAARGDYLVFVNSDAFVRRGALDALVSVLEEPDVGVVTGSLRLEKQSELINSAGNPMHFTGITWAGALGEPAAQHTDQRDVATASGAFFGVRADVWRQLGGFDPGYFMYHEDVDLSVRCWLSGWRVRYVPDAIADHDYSFTRNSAKFYFLERNRLITVLTDYPPRLLASAIPALLLTEFLLLLIALREGWATKKCASWIWILQNGTRLARRRRRVQRAAVDTQTLALVLASRVTTTAVSPPMGMNALNVFYVMYWRMVQSLTSSAAPREPRT